MRIIIISFALEVTEYLPVAGGSHRIEVDPYHIQLYGYKDYYKQL